MPDFSTKQREKLAEKGQAMPSGGFPIRHRKDLKRAIQAFGRAKNPDKTKAWILKRAKELDAMDLIPEKWLKENRVEHMSTTIENVDTIDEFLAHYGVKGMKWGQRKASSTVAEAIGLTRGKTPRDKKGNIKKPSYARELLIGTWANSKKRYTDPAARAQRTAAGKLFAASLVTNLAGVGLSVVAASTKNSNAAAGAQAVSQMLGGVGSITGLGSLVYGVSAARTERKSRASEG